MIPYDELVAVLQDWRGRKGLGVAATRSARVSAQSAAVQAPVPAYTSAPAFVPAPPVMPPVRTSAAFAAAPLPAIAAFDDFEGGGTEIREDIESDHVQGEGTGEIDIDAEAVDVLDEQVED